MADHPQYLLSELLADLFSPHEFEQFLATHYAYARIARQLPSSDGTRTNFFQEAVRALEMHGLLDDEFFDALVVARTHHRYKIDAVRVLIVPTQRPRPELPRPALPNASGDNRFVRFAKTITGLFRSSGEPEDDDLPPEHVVSTGFANTDTPLQPLATDRPLRTNTAYFFWLEVGAAQPSSIEHIAVSLPVDMLPRDAHLVVLLFTNEGGLVFKDDEPRGELLLAADGRVRVVSPASRPRGMLRAKGAMRRRLFFAVRTPPHPGTYQMRCSIHCRRVLVQSRDIRVTVAEDTTEARPGALNSSVDYTLTRKLTRVTLSNLNEHRLSLFVNDNEPGTHGFRFCAGDDRDEFHGSASLDTDAIQNLINNARKAYRLVSWGEAPFNPENYRYQQSGTYETLRTDLVALARRGWAMYAAIAGRLAGGRPAVERLRELMIRPGKIQLALKSSARLVLPLALFYDHDLDTQLPLGDYRLCDAFKLASRDGRVSDCNCLRGRCPNRGQRDVVCPGGFWGFRHEIGMPVSLGNADDTPTEAATKIVAHGTPNVLIVRSHDPELQRADGHIRLLRGLVGESHCNVANTRKEALGELQKRGRHLVYFYCHGGLDDDGNPCLYVGPPGDAAIAPDNLLAFQVRWDAPRPLVVINGCHTIDVEPERAIDLVGAFLDTAGASGVVGTEITVFEPLATEFAQLMLPAFLSGVPLGEAIRRARVDLLANQHNPLGLVYIPFAISSLALVQVEAG